MKKLQTLFLMFVLAVAMVFSASSHRSFAGDIEFPGYAEIPYSAGEGYTWVQMNDGLWYRMRTT